MRYTKTITSKKREKFKRSYGKNITWVAVEKFKWFNNIILNGFTISYRYWMDDIIKII